MFPNLNAEIGRAKLTIKRLSEITNINYETLKLKLRGVTEFKLAEMISIKKNAFPDKTLDYLFQTNEEKKTGQGVNKLNKKEISLTEAEKAKKESRQAMYWSITALVISIITCVFVIMRLLLLLP